MSQGICNTDNCTRPVRVGQRCRTHWAQWRHSINPPAPCTIPGCDRDHVARGWCSRHYDRWRQYGDPLGRGRPRGERRPLADRCWERIDKNGPVPESAPHLGPCWVWTGTRTDQGYGRLSVGGHSGKTRAAHRTVFELLAGPIPEGLHLDHLCRVRHCVKAIEDEHGPAHLEPVTPLENIRRGHLGAKRRGRTRRVPVPQTCPSGHSLEGQPLRVRVVWECRCCGLEYSQEHHLPARKLPPPYNTRA